MPTPHKRVSNLYVCDPENPEANGAIIYINADAAVDIYAIRNVLTRTHKAK